MNNEKRDSEIVADRSAGMTYRELGVKYEITRERCRGICNRAGLPKLGRGRRSVMRCFTSDSLVSDGNLSDSAHRIQYLPPEGLVMDEFKEATEAEAEECAKAMLEIALSGLQDMQLFKEDVINQDLKWRQVASGFKSITSAMYRERNRCHKKYKVDYIKTDEDHIFATAFYLAMQGLDIDDANPYCIGALPLLVFSSWKLYEIRKSLFDGAAEDFQKFFGFSGKKPV